MQPSPLELADFMLGAACELNDERREHLVVEIKRPIVKIGRSERDQITDYALAVAADSQFSSDVTDWVFVLVGTEIDGKVLPEVRQKGQPIGLLSRPEGGNYSIWIRTWGEILGECKHRLKFVRQELAYDPSRDQGLDFLRVNYPDYLPDSLVQGGVAAQE